MNIYKVERTDRWGYDDYDSFVCYANDEEEAKHLSPDGYHGWHIDSFKWQNKDGTWSEAFGHGWVKTDKDLKVTLIGFSDMPEGTKPSVILASYNAG